MSVSTKVTNQGVVSSNASSSTFSVEVPLVVSSPLSTSAVVFSSTSTVSGSFTYAVGAPTQVTTDSTDGSWTIVDVTGKYVVNVSGSSPSSLGGFTTSGGIDGQVCLFVNTGTKNLQMAGFADGGYPLVPSRRFFPALYMGSSWYKMSGSY